MLRLFWEVALPPALGPPPLPVSGTLHCEAGCLYHIQPPWAHQSRPINNLGPCLPPAPKVEAQARISSSTKPSVTTLEGSSISFLQNSARKGKASAKESNRNCLPYSGRVWVPIHTASHYSLAVQAWYLSNGCGNCAKTRRYLIYYSKLCGWCERGSSSLMR